ncbi:hypothetical protein GCM10009617_24530 [Leifsonia poae]|uniref:Uncharacterized protein n=1 Tax=Leifsonia poae TaxID=110933 RepID=A0A9W6H8Y6_9MICO|nr:hypothetical protein GCM10017584_13350 [Leifsonia poae]
MGRVENAITARNAAAITQKPVPWRRRHADRRERDAVALAVLEARVVRVGAVVVML